MDKPPERFVSDDAFHLWTGETRQEHGGEICYQFVAALWLDSCLRRNDEFLSFFLNSLHTHFGGFFNSLPRPFPGGREKFRREKFALMLRGVF